MLKKIIKSNPFFYQLYFHLVRKNVGIRPPWFKKSTQIYFDGYPRSGNTFLSHLLRNVLFELESVHHLHCVAAIKIALRKNILTYILLRNPLDAIASNYLKHFASKINGLPTDIDIKVLNDKTKDYVNYYSFVSKKRKRLNIIEFEYLIEKPKDVITLISRDYNLNFDKKDLEYALLYYYKDEEKLKQIPKDYKLKNKDGGKNSGGAKDVLGSSLPNDLKRKRKEEIANHLKDKDMFKKAQKIYASIVKDLTYDT